MRVSLGTIELDDDTRKKVGKAVTGSSYFKRDQAKDWALGLINAEIERITAGPPPVSQAQSHEGVAPATSPKDTDALPEPAPPTTV